jgi:alkanesulfonate monooxygenase SsuD/methylene tetrahydromethanopterin reductase-like flavin-dependent oxidoreductase (luciferase family)
MTSTQAGATSAQDFGHPITFGLVTGQHQFTLEQLLDQWRWAEELGFDSIFVFDHFLALYGDVDGPCLEASTLLAALALTTSRVRIGCLVYGNTHRHPAVFAKEMVTIDHLSGGRLILGIGSGWNEREHSAYSIPFPSAGDRVAMLDESLSVIRSLLTERRTTFDGRFYQLNDAPFSPKPLQDKLPIMVGGKRPKMLQVIAKHADIWDAGGTPDEYRERSAQIDRHCAEIDRDPAGIVRSHSFGADQLENVAGFTDLIHTYRAAGVSQFLFDSPITPQGRTAVERVARDLIPGLRAG